MVHYYPKISIRRSLGFLVNQCLKLKSNIFTYQTLIGVAGTNSSVGLLFASVTGLLLFTAVIGNFDNGMGSLFVGGLLSAASFMYVPRHMIKYTEQR